MRHTIPFNSIPYPYHTMPWYGIPYPRIPFILYTRPPLSSVAISHHQRVGKRCQTAGGLICQDNCAPWEAGWKYKRASSSTRRLTRRWSWRTTRRSMRRWLWRRTRRWWRNVYLKRLFKKSATKQQGNCAPWESELAQGNMQNIYKGSFETPRW